ncbi:MAG: PQQ-dependent dehydrogenase, methanol/ethanol family [Proteobacteria bacterium]|nr:PQQ-dependent dehydrogenase, methanol/ethanol family [Pseudomonadota bacterium]
MATVCPHRTFTLSCIAIAALASFTSPACSKKESPPPSASTVAEPGTAAAPTATKPTVATVDAARITNADAQPHNWMSHGRDYAEQRFSPLDQVNRDNVGTLGLAWYYDIEVERGMEATPLVIDGRMYTTSGWSIVYALDARTGKQLWVYDPQVPRDWARRACCDVVNRGVAAWGDKVYVGTIDGRLVALDAATGHVAWDVRTTDASKPYTITGAPRVINGKVIIGNGGADLGVRGYVSAYDAATGTMVWRFHTVPGNPSDGFENPAMETAAKTWTGQWWQYGGGGTVWDSMAYDAELDLLYIGVGNGSPWNRDIRSPDGGDNLFLSSIVALKPNTGKYVWHYQTTPGDSWDFTATQHIVLLDLTIDGAERKVLVQAPKNGFFYVIDRTDGTLISANNYVPVTWATHVDKETGRPVEADNARYPDPAKPNLSFPGPFGGHNWHPMAYSPKTGLVYLPAQELPFVYQKDAGFKFWDGEWNLGARYAAAALPEDPAELNKTLPLFKGRLLAWNPVTNEKAFSVEHPGPWNGGILATAGGLLFQGTPGGEFAAYRDDNGEKLWSMQAQTGVVAGPMSYSVAGEQYIAVSVGWGTVFGLVVPGEQRAVSRVLAFKLGGTGTLAPRTTAATVPWPSRDAMPKASGRKKQIAAGREIYLARCVWCHGDGAKSGGVLPDLRKLDKTRHEVFNQVVLDGVYSARGMPGYKHLLSPADVEAVRQYVIARAYATRPPD